jgi:predicted Zn-dependent peptidase
MDYKLFKYNNINVHTVRTDKFKNCSIEVMFRNKMDIDKITSLNMLIDTMTYSCKKYPTRRDLAIAMENLYSTSIRGGSTRLGNYLFTSFVVDFLNPKYCDDNYLNDVLDLFHEVLFNPNIENKEFDKRSFNIAKNRLQANIETEKESPVKYAVLRSHYHMDKDSLSSYSLVGNLKDLKKISTSNLVNTYNYLFNNSTIEIYIIGNIDMNDIVKLLKKKFIFNNKKESINNLLIHNKLCNKVKNIEELGHYEQDSFIMLFNLDNLTEREKNFVLPVYNSIFGNGGLTAKLYKYIREENSLCYALDSSYEKYDALCMFYMGINQKDKNKCLELINKALQEMINGEFSDEELVDAKKSISTMIRASQDSIGGIINTYLFHELDGLPLVDEKIENYNSVTKEEIMNVAKKIKVNTCYLLKGEDEK